MSGRRSSNRGHCRLCYFVNFFVVVVTSINTFKYENGDEEIWKGICETGVEKLPFLHCLGYCICFQDIIFNTNIKLDKLFKFALCQDVAKVG